MANSVITKTALAKALKELMGEKPFSKISVSEITEKCRINRKSFYYHFNDKNDLINWIFESEFLNRIKDRGNGVHFDLFDDLCRYFYENKDFYRKVINIDEDNSFFQSFHRMVLPAVREKINKFADIPDLEDMYAALSADIIVCSIRRWLLDKNCIEPEKFLRSLRDGALRTAFFINNPNDIIKS